MQSAFDPLFFVMKTIQVMPAAEAKQYCVGRTDLQLGDENSSIQAISIGGGSPRLMKRRGMLIISRLPRTTHSEDKWLSAVRKAIDDLVKNDCVIVTSVGSVGWDYITWYAAKRRASLWIIFPPEGTDKLKQISDKVVQNLNINEKTATFFMPILSKAVSKSEKLSIRDQFVFSFAHKHNLICIRKKSTWTKYFNQLSQVNRDYQVDYPDKHSEIWKPLLKSRKLASDSTVESKNYLIHWTRGANGPWSGESEADYLEALTDNISGNPRNGYHTLKKIVLSKLLRGSGKMIKGGEPVICFTDTNFTEIFKLIRYRATLGRWNFEPYGIGFPRDLLKSIGARCVSYGSREKYDELSAEEKPYFQYDNAGTKNGRISSNWLIEGEWRLIGDLDFESIIRKVILIVPTRKEANILYREIGINSGLRQKNIHCFMEDLSA